MNVHFLRLKGARTRGNRSNYRKVLCEEMLLDEINLQNAMLDRDYWKKITRFCYCKFRHAFAVEFNDDDDVIVCPIIIWFDVIINRF